MNNIEVYDLQISSLEDLIELNEERLQAYKIDKTKTLKEVEKITTKLESLKAQLKRARTRKKFYLTNK